MPNFPRQSVSGLIFDSRTVAVPQRITITSRPMGSAVAAALSKSVQSLSFTPMPGVSTSYEIVSFSFIPDESGIYVLSLDMGNGATTTQSVEVATKASKSFGMPGADDAATVELYVDGGVVISAVVDGVAFPRLTKLSAKGEFASGATGVKSALGAMVGMTAANVNSAGMPALESAWSAALATPSAENQNPAVASLVAAGWTT